MSKVVEPRGRGVIALTLVIAMILSVLPLPYAVEPFRPAWVMMVLIYWP